MSRAGKAMSTSSLPLSQPTAPLGYFLRSVGPAADPVRYLGWALAALCVAVCVIIAVLLALAIWRKRRPSDMSIGTRGEAKGEARVEAGVDAGGVMKADPSDIAPRGNGMRFVYIGSGLSTLALFAALAYMLIVLADVAQPPARPALTLTVTAYDWWWKIQYDDAGAQPSAGAQASAGTQSLLVTANEIHIPVGVPVRIRLVSADVIHAFWVPLLAGKTQMIPGQVNQQWIQADQPGIYRGQCSQYCGAQHAHMAFEVVAQSRADFEAWRQAQLRPAAQPHADAALRGANLFEAQCAGCHTVRGSAAHGAQAPDLTHVGSRRLIAAGTLPNTPATLLDWITHAQTIKPESLMPSIKLSASDAADLSAYLALLR